MIQVSTGFLSHAGTFRVPFDFGDSVNGTQTNASRRCPRPYYLVAVGAAAAGAEVGFEELGLEDDAVFAGDDFAGQQASDDFGQVAILDARPDGADVKELGTIGAGVIIVADEND